MSNKDIWDAYANGTSSTPTGARDLYQRVLEGQLETGYGEPVKSVETGKPVTGAEMERQVKASWPTLSATNQSVAQAVRRMKAGELGVDVGNETGKGESRMFDNNDLEMLNDLPAEDQVKIKNLLNKLGRESLAKVLTPYAKKKLDQVMPMILYSSINVGEFTSMLDDSKNDLNLQLLNADFLISAQPGVYPISEFVIKDGTPYTQDGVEVQANFADLVLQSLKALKPLGAGGAQAGPYESALQLLSNGRITQEGKGDIVVDGQLLELKAESGRVGPEEWPARKQIVALAQKAVGDAMDKYLSDNPNLKAVKEAELAELARKGTSYGVFDETLDRLFGQIPNAQHIRREILSPIAEKLYDGAAGWQNIVDTFAYNYSNFKAIIAKELFDMYKAGKTSKAEGKWDRLIGINLETGSSIAIFDTGSDLASAVVNNQVIDPLPNIIATGPAAARDYMFQLDLR